MEHELVAKLRMAKAAMSLDHLGDDAIFGEFSTTVDEMPLFGGEIPDFLLRPAPPCLQSLHLLRCYLTLCQSLPPFLLPEAYLRR